MLAECAEMIAKLESDSERDGVDTIEALLEEYRGGGDGEEERESKS